MNTPRYIRNVTSDDFSLQVLEKSREQPVLVDFWAAWCGPCKALAPVLERLAEEYQGQLVVAKVDTDQQTQLAMKHGIRSIPTVKLFKDGAVVDEFHGALPESEVRAFIERHLVHESDRLHAAASHAYRHGDLDRAVALWEQALVLPPVRPQVRVDLARAYIDQGNYEAAEQCLKSLPLEVQVESQASALRTLITLARTADAAPDDEALKTRIEQSPDDCEARYRYGTRKIIQGNYQEGLEQLLEILRREPGFRDNAAREGMVAVFALLGNQGDLVNRYRRLMFATLH